MPFPECCHLRDLCPQIAVVPLDFDYPCYLKEPLPNSWRSITVWWRSFLDNLLGLDMAPVEKSGPSTISPRLWESWQRPGETRAACRVGPGQKECGQGSTVDWNVGDLPRGRRPLGLEPSFIL